MSVTLLTQPDLFALTQGGRMRFHFQADARLQSAGAKAVYLLFCENVPDGTTLTLAWADQRVTFTARTTPTGKDDLPIGSSGEPYMRQLVAVFCKHYLIRADYVVDYFRDPLLGPTCRLTARRVGAIYQFTTTLTGQTFRLLKDTPGLDPLQRDRYGVLVELWAQTEGGSTDPATFEKLADQPLEADGSGQVVFDAGAWLHTHLSADGPLATDSPYLSRRSTRAYFLAYAECWGGPLQVGEVTESDLRYAIWGGADYLRRADGGFPLSGYIGGVTSVTDQALRPGGSLTRYTLPDQPQYLTFLNGRDEQSGVRAEFTLTFAGGSTSIKRVPLVDSWPVGQTLTFATGLTQQQLGQNGQAVVAYAVKLLSGGGSTLSQTYKYIVDGAYRPYARHLRYVNSLGCVDTISTWGKGTPDWEMTVETAERSLTTYTVGDAQFVDYDVTVQNQIELATGYRDASELPRWLDFYRSATRHLWQNGKCVPIQLLSKSIKQAQDGDDLVAHTFKIALAWADSFSYDEGEKLSDPLPPPGFAGGGVTIQRPVITPIVDPTVSQAARDLTLSDLVQMRQVLARPDPLALGLITVQTAAGLFPTKATVDAAQQLLQTQLQAVKSRAATQIKLSVRAI